MAHKIEVTEYTREDGLTAIRCTNRRWVVRKVDGTSWFYSHTHKNWKIAYSISSDDLADHFEMSEQVALTILETVEK